MRPIKFSVILRNKQIFQSKPENQTVLKRKKLLNLWVSAISVDHNEKIKENENISTTPGQSGPGSNDNEGILRIPQSFCITKALLSD